MEGKTKMSRNKITWAMLSLALLAGFAGHGVRGQQPSRAVVAERRSRPGYVPKHLRVRGIETAGPAKTVDEPTVEWSAAADDLRIERSGVRPASFEEIPSYIGDACETCDGCGRTACAGGCCFPVSLSMRGEYLLWSLKGQRVPALATSSPSSTPQAQAGVLGTVGVRTLLGGDEIAGDSRSGFRLGLSLLLDPHWDQAIDVEYSQLADDGDTFHGTASDFSILARPFFNSQTNAEDSRLIVFPNLVTGTLDIRADTGLETLTAGFRRLAAQSGISSMDLFAGYRYARLEDDVQFLENTASLSGPTEGATFLLSERFRSENQFQGGQLAARYHTHDINGWVLELNASLALGNNHSGIDVRGSTQSTSAAGASNTVRGGLLVQGTNAGHFEQDDFSTISEFRANLRRQLTWNVSALVGYNFLLWTNTIRAGDNIDRTLNPSQIPPGTLTGDPRPEFPMRSVDFWAQGLSAGLEVRF